METLYNVDLNKLVTGKVQKKVDTTEDLINSNCEYGILRESRHWQQSQDYTDFTEFLYRMFLNELK